MDDIVRPSLLSCARSVRPIARDDIVNAAVSNRGGDQGRPDCPGVTDVAVTGADWRVAALCMMCPVCELHSFPTGCM
jgi:hypothetical protein